MPDPKWIHDMAHKIDIISVREQIQEDIITYADAYDGGWVFTDEMVNQLCDIVVSNFDKLLNK